MNYLILKNIIETTIQNFRCQNCGGTIHAKDINLLGTSQGAVNMEVTCPSCKTVGVIKAEVNIVGSPQNAIPSDIVGQIRTLMQSSEPSGGIRDADIISLRKSLQSGKSVEEIFGQE